MRRSHGEVRRSSTTSVSVAMGGLLPLLLAVACGSTQGHPHAPHQVGDDRTFGSGGLVTVGLRLALDDDEHLGQVHLEAITMDMDGATRVDDLGFFEGEMQQMPLGASELGHLRFQEGAEVHDLVLFETLDPNRLELRLDGELYFELTLPAHDALEVRQPFLDGEELQLSHPHGPPH